jgi:hypothetical protein
MQIKDMTANNWNFNVMSREDYEKMKQGIKENHDKGLPLWEGEKVIVCEGNNHYLILDGEHKTRACRELGIKEISDDLILNKGRISKSEQMKVTETKNIRGTKDPIKYADIHACKHLMKVTTSPLLELFCNYSLVFYPLDIQLS